jgi:hypothetical protein
MNILHLRQSRSKSCACCSRPFVPRQPDHNVCSLCFAWLAASWHQSRMADLLRDVSR